MYDNGFSKWEFAMRVAERHALVRGCTYYVRKSLSTGRWMVLNEKEYVTHWYRTQNY